MIIAIKSNLDTLNYLLENMIDGQDEVQILDITDQAVFFEKIKQLDPHIDHTARVITFNNMGYQLIVNGYNYWEKKNVIFYDYLVDHPIYYIEELAKAPFMHVLCVDRYHRDFVRKYFPQIKDVQYLPLGGAKPKREMIKKWTDREIDILYTGRRYPNFFQEQSGNNSRMFIFFNDMYHLLCQHPDFTVEKLFEIYEEEMHLDFGENRLKVLQDVYASAGNAVRAYYQDAVIEHLAQHGLTIDICGDGWEALEQRYPDRIRLHGRVSPGECAEKMCDAKISLNLMPWFKYGSHDRIYNAMFAGSLCVTDTSEYLEKKFVNDKNILMFHLTELEGLADRVRKILDDGDRAEKIVQEQFKAVEQSGWANRYQNILSEDFLEDSFR